MSTSSADPAFPGVELRLELDFGKTELCALAWAPDGRMLACAGRDGRIYLVEPTSGRSIDAIAAHDRPIGALAFSPDGATLVSGGSDRTVRIWAVPQQGRGARLLGELDGFTARVSSLAWISDTCLATASHDGTVRVWHGTSSNLAGAQAKSLVAHTRPVNALVHSATAERIASASNDGTVLLWATDRLHGCRVLLRKDDYVHCVVFSTDGQLVASGADDGTVTIQQMTTGDVVRVIEGFGSPRALAFSSDGRLLASKADAYVSIFRCDTWQPMGRFEEDSATGTMTIGFGRDGTLATYGDRQCSIRLWRVDADALLERPVPRRQYANAKVVLLGDSGVGKSALAAGLLGKPFAATESTHARSVSLLSSTEAIVTDDSGEVRETREVFLWDLAGQPGYRLIHQLHLHDTTIAILVYDCRSEEDPFSGVEYWDRALRQAQRAAGSSRTLVKLLAGARSDRGRIGVADARLRAFCDRAGIPPMLWFETSAKEDRGVKSIRTALERVIDWDAAPKITSTDQLAETRTLIASLRSRGRRMITISDLRASLLGRDDGRDTAASSLELEACIAPLESQGILRRLPFGNLLLLEPELLDFYASSIVEAARDDSQGLGSIPEDDVKEARFRLPHEGRLQDPGDEQLLLLATVTSLLRAEVGVRENTSSGVMLVFPAQSTRPEPAMTGRLIPTLRVTFEGASRSIYSTLAVRLSQSGAFWREDLWRDGLLLRDAVGAPCAIRLKERDSAPAEIEVLVGPESSLAVRAQLERFVREHVARTAVAGSIREDAIVTCPSCSEAFERRVVDRALQLGKAWLICPVCEVRAPLSPQLPVEHRSVERMARSADTTRDDAVAASTIEGKRAANDYDVFLCHHSADKAEARSIARALMDRGYLAWLDERDAPPGIPWMEEIERQIQSTRAAAVLLGPEGQGDWQRREVTALLVQCDKRGCPVIPVMLRTASEAQTPPSMLSTMGWVDFRRDEPDPMDRLIWGITRGAPARRPPTSTR